jgi:ribokinase
MVGRVGDDDFGERLLLCLKQHGVDAEHVVVTEGVSTGVAMILVDKKGENSIVVAPGANALLTPDDVDAARDVIASASVVLMQLEIPLATIKHAIALCQELGVYTILDPAPATAKLPRSVLGVDLFTPNQSEAEILLDRGRTMHVSKKRIADPKQSASDLLSRGARSVVLKLGSKGALYADHEGAIVAAKAFKVNVVDTTAAGDCFSAGLAIGRSEGMSMPDMLRFANAAGALCCQGFGAQSSLPSRDAVDSLLRSAG